MLPADVWSVVVALDHSTTLSSTCKELHALLGLLTCPGCGQLKDGALCARCGCRRQSRIQRMIQAAAYSFNHAGIDRHCHKELLQVMKKRKIDAMYVMDVEKKMKKISRAVKRLKSFNKNEKDLECFILN